MSWIELQLVIPRRAVEAVSGRLFEDGAIGCQEDYLPGEKPPARQPWDTGPEPAPPDRILLRAWWESASRSHAQAATLKMLAALQIESEPRWIQVEDDGWSDAWKSACVRVMINDSLAVAPPWKAESGDLIVEPGMAFGTGDHPTTLSCLRAIVEHAVPGEACLDVGTGSGVLAICAARMGMKARGIDIDADSVRAAKSNALLNGVDIEADMTPMAGVDGRFELVVANLFAEVLVMLADDLKRVTKGHLSVAGVLSDRSEMVVSALAPMRLVRREEDGDWCHMGFEW